MQIMEKKQHLTYQQRKAENIYVVSIPSDSSATAICENQNPVILKQTQINQRTQEATAFEHES